MADSSDRNASKKSIKGRTTGQFRCLYCFKRVKPSKGAEQFICPHCGYAWRISWVNPDEPRIRGPVWETNERLSREETEKQGGA